MNFARLKSIFKKKQFKQFKINQTIIFLVFLEFSSNKRWWRLRSFSFQERTREGSKLVYPVTAAPIRLSLKKYISSFSFFVYAPIFRQYIFRWLLEQVVPLYLSNSSTLCRNLPFGGRATRDSRVRLPRKEYARSRHQRLFEENVGKTGKDVVYEL